MKKACLLLLVSFMISSSSLKSSVHVLSSEESETVTLSSRDSSVKSPEDTLEEYFSDEVVSFLDQLKQQLKKAIADDDISTINKSLEAFYSATQRILQARKKLDLTFKHKGARYTFAVMKEIELFYRVLVENIIEGDKAQETWVFTHTNLALTNIIYMYSVFAPFSSIHDANTKEKTLEEMRDQMEYLQTKDLALAKRMLG